MKNNGLLILALAAAAYFLTQKKTGASTTPSGNGADCMSFSEATAYMAVRWLQMGRLPNTMPNLGDFLPAGTESGGVCITKRYIDNLIAESV